MAQAPAIGLNPDAVVQFAAVTVRRGGKALIDSVDWTVEVDERWAVLGPNGAGKTTLLQIAAAVLHPTSGAAYVLGERLGAVDVFELRPRIGLASAALADRIPMRERVRDVVVSAGYSVIGRWREAYGEPDVPAGLRDTVLKVIRQRLALHEHPGAVADALRAVPRSRPFGAVDALAAISVPVTVVASADETDPGHPQAIGEAYAETIPAARLITDTPGRSPVAWQGSQLSQIIAEAVSDAGGY